MKTKKLLITFLLLTSLTFAGKAQTQKTIDSIRITYQNCLDKGENMLGCTRRYYSQMDSLLNVVYKNLRNQSDAAGKDRLKSEQKKWLTKRDAYFKKVEKDPLNEITPGELSRDEAMIIIDQKADYVRERVEALLRKPAN